MSSSDKWTHAYIGRGECGCALAMCVIIPEDLETTADMVSEMIIDGLSIERVPMEEVKLDRCLHQWEKFNEGD